MIEIREITPTHKALRKFTQFQIDLYKGNDCYVPPLVSDDINTLSPDKNPAFDFCDAAYFMAYEEGRPVGRIAGIINRQVNERRGEKNVRFGFIDFVDDSRVSEALVKAVEKWGKEKGMTHIVGPLGFTDLDQEGMLVDGFDRLSTMATIYNYPYYPEHLRKLGFEPDSEWVEYLIKVPDGIPEKHRRVTEVVERRFGLRILKFKSRKELKEKYGKAIFELVNEAYNDLYGYSPLTDRQIDAYIKMYLNLLNLDLVTLIADKEDKLVGIGISLPSMSKALQKSGGKFFPFGWYHLLKGLKGKNDIVDLLLVAVKPEYQGKGVNALLFKDLIPQYIKYGITHAESNPEMTTNNKVQDQWAYFENERHKRRVAFRKEIK